MKLALACNGEGRGHVSRIIALAEHLVHDYMLVFYAPSTVAPILEARFPGYQVKRIPHLHYCNKQFKIDYVATVQANTGLVLDYTRTVQSIRTDLAAEKVGAVISDFEPFVSQAAREMAIPLCRINHPAVVLRSVSFSFDALLAKLVSHCMLRGDAVLDIIVSFYRGDTGPFIREEIRTRVPVKGKKLLVYTKPAFHESLMKALATFDGLEYDLFPDPSRDFPEALASCRGVIAGAGHQIISEALHLGKPVLAIPARGQYEQRLNAIMLEKSGMGMYADSRNLGKALERFLGTIDQFGTQDLRTNERFHFKDDSKTILKMVRDFVSSSIPMKKAKQKTA